MYMIRRIFLAAAAFAGTLAQAQLPVVPGERALALAPSVTPQIRLSPAQPKAMAVLPVVSEAEVASVRAANARPGTKPQARRLVIGVVRGEQVLAAQGGLAWMPVPGGHAAQVAITSPDAGSMRLAIDLRAVPLDVEMVFFGSGGPRVEGPIRVGEIADRTSAWWSPITEGATQTVEFFVPSKVDVAAVHPRVTRASHIFTTPSSRFTKRLQEIGDSGSCNVDVKCSPLASNAAFRDMADSVAQMVLTQGGFSTLCTGTLLADSDPASQTPWFYTANHCFDNDEAPYKNPAELQQVANSLTTLWIFEAATCNSNVPDGQWSQLAGGATRIYSDVQSDVIFLRLHGTPPATAFYSGWDANPLAINTQVVAVHHPSGDLKKVSQGSVTGLSQPGVGGGFTTYHQVRWNSGTTEGGSSGGGLWSSSGGQYFLRGGLWGGAALCTNLTGLDSYSRFDQAYPQISAYLGSATGPTTDYSDLWWNPNESGWGLNLVQHPSRVLFGVWYTYEGDGTPTWFVMPQGTWTSSTTYTGPIFATTGPGFTKHFNPGAVQPRQVGSGTLNFSSANTGTFSYSIDGVTGTKQLQRQSF